MRAILSLLLLAAFGTFSAQGGHGVLQIRKRDTSAVSGVVPPVETFIGVRKRKIISVSDQFALKKFVVEESLYDSLGRLMQKTDHFRNHHSEYIYDSLGRISSLYVTNISLNQWVYKEVYRYPAKGVKECCKITLDQTKVDSKPDTVLCTESIFDERGLLLREIRKDKRTSEWTLFSYDSMGRMVSSITYLPGAKDSLLRTSAITYTPLKKETKTSAVSTKGGKKKVRELREVLVFDESGKCICEEKYVDGKLVLKKDYSFNEKGLISDMRSFEEDTAGVHYSHHLYEYNYYGSE